MTSSAYRSNGAGRLRAVLLTLGSAPVAALLAFGIAPLGTAGLYAIVGLIVCGIVGYALRSELAPPLSAAIERVRPQRLSTRAGGRPELGVFASTAAVVLGVGAAALLAGSQGMKALAGLAGALVVGVGIWLLWPLLHDLMTAAPTDLPARRSVPAHRAPPRPLSPLGHALGLSLVVVAAASAAWLAAGLGLQGMIALGGGIGVLALIGLVKDRSVFFTFAAVGSLTLVLHKSLSTQDLSQSGGAISIYVTTFDVVLLVLYGIWISEGTFATDVRVAFRRRILWLPLVGAIFLLPSLLSVPSVTHAVSELFRMGWMYLLFVYVAVRVRTRRHVWAVLGGLAVFAVIELAVVSLQATTGGVLGLSFLGVPTQLGERTTDSTVIGRPFGTIIHPVFMGAVLGALALMALAMAIELRRSLAKIAASVLVPVCLLPLYIAQTRAALVSFAIVAVVLIGTGIARSRLTWPTIWRMGLGLAVAAIAFLPQLMAKYSANFGTGHYAEEIDSRTQLNDIAVQMISDHWGLGVGLNNFELVLPAYEPHDVIFFGNPVHNLYLLYLAETGIVGFAGVVVVGFGLFLVAIRVARSKERLLGGVGVGVAGAMAFFMIEELLGFSLRQDIPLAMYWLLAGLAVACCQLAGPEGARQRGRHCANRATPASPGARSGRIDGSPTHRNLQLAHHQDVHSEAGR